MAGISQLLLYIIVQFSHAPVGFSVHKIIIMNCHLSLRDIVLNDTKENELQIGTSVVFCWSNI